jgi:hypothetical protein
MLEPIEPKRRVPIVASPWLETSRDLGRTVMIETRRKPEIASTPDHLRPHSSPDRPCFERAGAALVPNKQGA